MEVNIVAQPQRGNLKLSLQVKANLSLVMRRFGCSARFPIEKECRLGLLLGGGMGILEK